MERRYLVATLALVATFAIFSRELRSGQLANLPCSRAELRADLACAKEYVADQLVAKVRPFVDRGVPEEQQMAAELNLPVLAAANERVAEVQAQIARQTAERNCEAGVRAQEQALRAQEAGFRAQERALRAAEHAQERAIELSARASERAQEINERTALRAQEISNRAVERAQRAMGKSKWRIVVPNVPDPPGAPMPIDFEVGFPSDFDRQVQAEVDNRLAVRCVRTRVADQQFRTIMIQRANQNMTSNLNVIVSTQDVSGLSALAQTPASQNAMHWLGRGLQHIGDHFARTVYRAFATL